MFFTFPHQGGVLNSKVVEASVNLQHIAFVEFGSVKETPFANVHFISHARVFTITGQEQVARLRQAIAAHGVPSNDA